MSVLYCFSLRKHTVAADTVESQHTCVNVHVSALRCRLIPPVNMNRKEVCARKNIKFAICGRDLYSDLRWNFLRSKKTSKISDDTVAPTQTRSRFKLPVLWIRIGFSADPDPGL